jgi:hypothetical protein
MVAHLQLELLGYTFAVGDELIAVHGRPSMNPIVAHGRNHYREPATDG